MNKSIELGEKLLDQLDTSTWQQAGNTLWAQLELTMSEQAKKIMKRFNVLLEHVIHKKPCKKFINHKREGNNVILTYRNNEHKDIVEVLALKTFIDMDKMLPYYEHIQYVNWSFLQKLFILFSGNPNNYFLQPSPLQTTENIDILKQLLSDGTDVQSKFKSFFQLDEYIGLSLNRFEPDYQITACGSNAVECFINGKHLFIKKAELFDFSKKYKKLVDNKHG